ncbi:MAG: AAA family ATPase [Firmicutes bacterium]|nr:AAA family ATPase [Bacillota bacterium]
MIEKIKMKNYKKFIEEEIIFNSGRNIFVGENGVGKSSILQAISYVLSGSYSKIESIGLPNLLNIDIIDDFMTSKKKYDDLPILEIELYICEDIKNFSINGKHNSERKECNGLRMIAAPDDEYSSQIIEALKSTFVFPFEYYKLDFQTFSGKSYNSMSRYNDFIRFSMLDTSKVNSKNALKDYVHRIYESQSDTEKRKIINNAYRNKTAEFSSLLYSDFDLLASDDGYTVALDINHENTFADNITIKKEGIDITNMGQGEKVFINADFAMTKAPDDVNIVLIEEPENHLSFLSMHRLVDKIIDEKEKQTFIATHSNMIAARLNLNNVIFISENGCAKLNELKLGYAKFFEKSPDNSVLNFILSEKSILVEGSAEYIVLEGFYKHVIGNSMHKDNIALISCGGKTFKNYLSLAKLLNKKTVVITDNDGDYESNVVDNYSGFESDKIKVFAELYNDLSTFEIALYKNNEEFYEKYIATDKMVNGIQHYMLNNKAEASLRLLLKLDKKPELFNDFKVPSYIEDAIKWINE